MINWLKSHVKKIGIIFIVLLIFSFILMFQLPLVRSFSIVFGSVGVLFLPGFFFTFIFFPKSRSLKDPINSSNADIHALDGIERIILSIFFSITLTTLTFTFIRHFGIGLTPLRVTLVIVFLNLVNIAGVLLISQRQKKG